MSRCKFFEDLATSQQGSGVYGSKVGAALQVDHRRRPGGGTRNTLEHFSKQSMDVKKRTLYYVLKPLMKSRTVYTILSFSVTFFVCFFFLEFQIIKWILNSCVKKHLTAQWWSVNLTLFEKSKETRVTCFACPRACVWSLVEGPTPTNTHTQLCRFL